MDKRKRVLVSEDRPRATRMLDQPEGGPRRTFADDLPRFALLLLGVFLLVQPWLADIPGRGTAAGEAIAGAENYLLAGSFVAVLGRKLLRRERLSLPLIAPAALFLLLGLVSAIASRTVGSPTIVGAFLALRMYTVFVLVANIDMGDWAARFPRFLMIVGAPVALLAAAQWLFPGIQTALHPLPFGAAPVLRLGRLVPTSVFTTPGDLASFLVYVCLFGVASFIVLHDRGKLVGAVLLALVTLLTLRSKPLLGLLATFPLVLVFVKDQGKRIRGLVIGALVIAALVSGVAVPVLSLHINDYRTYPLSGDARLVLYATSARIATDAFPFGVGFGRFGTWPSAASYSTVYDRYGISAVWGLSRAKRSFITDTFWPGILGETGLFGLVAFAFLLTGMAAPAFRIARSGSAFPAPAKVVAIGASLVFLEGLVESLASPTFVAMPSAFLIAVPLAVCYSLEQRDAEARRVPDEDLTAEASA